MQVAAEISELSTIYPHTNLFHKKCVSRLKIKTVVCNPEGINHRLDKRLISIVYPRETSPFSLIARIERQPEQRKRPDFVARSFLLHTRQEITSGNTEEPIVVEPLLKKAIASSAVLLILKN